MLLLVAFVGLVVGDGLFLLWLLTEYRGLAAVLQDHLALSFIIDAFLTLGILAAHFAKSPPGRFRWPWFVLFSVLGGLCFGLPFYWWLNRRPGSVPASTGA